MISVDLQDAIPESLIAVLGADFFGSVLDDVAAAARAHWIQLAQGELGATKRDYIQGIQEIEAEGETRSISLVGWLPNAVEQGIDPYDMRETLLGPGKGKTAKDGSKYRAIPFRHSTPGTSGQAGGVMGMRYGPQGAQSRAFGAGGQMDGGSAVTMGMKVYNKAKRLKPGQRLPDEIRLKGDGLPATVPLLAPWHKTSIYSGMRKVSKVYEKTTQNTYQTFRMISTKNHVGWIHPGINARHLAQRVESHIQELVPQAIEAALKAALQGMGQ